MELEVGLRVLRRFWNDGEDESPMERDSMKTESESEVSSDFDKKI